MISDFKHQVRKAMEDFVRASAKDDLSKDQRRSLDRSHAAILRLLNNGEDANSIVHTMLGLIAAMVMKTAPEDQKQEAMKDMIGAFTDYLAIHTAPPKKTGITRH